MGKARRTGSTLLEVSLDAQLGTAPADSDEATGLVAEANNDLLTAGAGSDSFVFADAGQETITDVAFGADAVHDTVLTDSLVFTADAGHETITEIASDISTAEPDAGDVLVAQDVDDSVIVQTVATTSQYQDDVIV